MSTIQAGSRVQVVGNRLFFFPGWPQVHQLLAGQAATVLRVDSDTYRIKTDEQLEFCDGVINVPCYWVELNNTVDRLGKLVR